MADLQEVLQRDQIENMYCRAVTLCGCHQILKIRLEGHTKAHWRPNRGVISRQGLLTILLECLRTRLSILYLSTSPPPHPSSRPNLSSNQITTPSITNRLLPSDPSSPPRFPLLQASAKQSTIVSLLLLLLNTDSSVGLRDRKTMKNLTLQKERCP